MSKPNVKQLGSVYTFTWQEEGVAARIDHVRRHTNGDLSCEITVKATRPGESGHIHHSMMSNMLGPRIRDAVVKACEKRSPGIQWEQMVETVCEYVVEKHREGKPSVLLADVALSEALDWRVYPYVYEKAPTVLFGLGGSGKSMLAAWLAIRVAIGIDAEPGNVLILDWESSDEDWKRRVMMVSQGLGCGEPPNIIYQSCVEPLSEMVETARNLVAENDVEFVIVDSAAYACGGEPEKADPTMQFFRALRALDCTSVTIAHQNSDDHTKKPFGSVYWSNSPRATIQVVRSEEDTDTEFDIALYQRKRNQGGKWKPVGFNMKFVTESPLRWTEGDKVVISERSILEMPDLASTASNPDRIYDLLKHGSMDIPAISMELGIDVNVVKTTLYRMKTRGQVQQLTHGWGLPDHTFGDPIHATSNSYNDDLPGSSLRP